MTRLFFRFVGLLFLACAFAALIVDGTRSISSGSLEILPLGRSVTKLAPELFVKVHTATETHAPLLWDPVLVTILLMPGWLVFAFIGFVFMVLTRPRTPKIGYSRR